MAKTMQALAAHPWSFAYAKDFCADCDTLPNPRIDGFFNEYSASQSPLSHDGVGAGEERRVDLIVRRYTTEAWTTEDLFAAMLQASLLSYRSSPDLKDKHGSRYVDSAPEDYANNCPWNDWTPPSQSAKLFADAHVKLASQPQEVVSQRVRVRLSSEAAPDEDTLIAFASVEKNRRGRQCLLLRRGADILASMAIGTLRGTCMPERRVLLSSTLAPGATHTPFICLKFENDQRLHKFCDMLLAKQ